MIYRQATAQDAIAIRDIWNPFISDTVISFSSIQKSEADVLQYLADHAAKNIPVFVAEANGTVLGFATYGAFRAGDGYLRCAEHTIYLAPDARGRGVGRELMQMVEDAARNRDIHIMVAGVSADNSAGIAFHQALGYQITAQMPQMGYKFGRFHDLVMLQKTL